ncbi:MAG: flagellar basal body rod C-terminal domain-containing protein [Candidatus Poribacteria bacterium]|jgi:flagellar hook-associated protein 1 FlgK|nr:flagellar basal body rod C-terminal domain-containing protein [Candidatus Poribacteria bacterium]
MTNLLGSIEMAKQSLNAQRHGLTVAGHNIANINTPNYARERVEISIDVRGHSLAGAAVTHVTQVRDKILENRLHQSIQESISWQTQSDQLQKTESLFTDLQGGGVSNAMAAFWDSWQNLSTDPESKDISRSITIGRAQSLVKELKTLNSGLQTMYEEANIQIRDFSSKVNEIADSIANLNRDIASIEYSGQSANSQRTLRGSLLTELSEYTNFSIFEETNGMLQISFGGFSLVDGMRASKLAIQDRVPSSDNFSSNQPNTKSILYDEINQLAESFAGVNQEILSHQGTAIALRDLKNQRDEIETQITTRFNLVDLTEFTFTDIGDGSGMRQIEVKGNLLVDGTRISKLSLDSQQVTADINSPLFGKTEGTVINPKNGEKVSIQGGKIGGLVNFRDNQLTQFIDRINTFATTLMAEVNAVHVKGYGLDNTTGLEFFTGNNINDIEVNSILETNPEKIGVSSVKDAAGNNLIALAIVERRNTFLMSDGTQTLEDYYASTMTFVGIQSQQAQRNEENNELLVSQLETFRESYSGVSLDEEMVNLIQFQRAYEASARYISTVDRVMQTLINM